MTLNVVAPDTLDTTAPGAVVVLVDPDTARKWLAVNSHNRNIRPGAVFDYARDMAAGHWRLNGEAVKFCRTGVLDDGQHRLLAVIEAGVPVAMLVVTGLEPEAQDTMDAGRKRTTSDVFGLRGEAHAAILASVTKKVWMWEQGDYRFSANPSPTTAECAELLARRPEIRRSAEVASRVRHAFKYLPQSVTGAAHLVLSDIDRSAAVWFFQRLADGAELPLGHPLLTLRNRCISDSTERRGTPPDRYMAYLVRTWNAVRDGRPLARIIQAPDAAMPMPH